MTKGRDVNVIVRGYAPHGVYWREPLVLPDAIYLPDERVVMTVCRLTEHQGVEEPFSEFDNPRVEEFRLLAALALAVGYDEGLVVPQPLSVSLRISTPMGAFDHCIHNELRSRLLAHWEKVPPSPLEGPYPPANTGDYNFRGGPTPLAMQARLYAAIDPSDQLMSRGLRMLLRFTMLSGHPMFSEEATYPLHVALEASFALLRRQFSQEGLPNSTSREVAARFETIFSESASGENYFEDYYADRIMAQHPDSRHGVSHYIPGTHGERLWLFKALREVYRYLLLEEVVNPQA